MKTQQQNEQFRLIIICEGWRSKIEHHHHQFVGKGCQSENKRS